MANTATVTVTGVAQALQKLRGYSESVKTACKEAVKTHTEAIATQARQTVPVDTGRLKQSITTDYSSLGYFGRARAQTPYAHIVERGTSTRPAKPFLHPAYESEKPKFIEAVRKAVKR